VVNSLEVLSLLKGQMITVEQVLDGYFYSNEHRDFSPFFNSSW